MGKKIEIKDSSGNKVSFKQFKVASREALLKDNIPQAQLVSNGIFTRSEINSLVSRGKLRKIVLNDVVYINQKDATRYFRDLNNMEEVAGDKKTSITGYDGKPTAIKNDPEYHYDISIAIKITERRNEYLNVWPCGSNQYQPYADLYDLSGEDLEKTMKHLRERQKHSKDMEEQERKCPCDEPTCAKCLSVNCQDENCQVHTKERKAEFKIRYQNK